MTHEEAATELEHMLESWSTFPNGSVKAIELAIRVLKGEVEYRAVSHRQGTDTHVVETGPDCEHARRIARAHTKEGKTAVIQMRYSGWRNIEYFT